MWVARADHEQDQHRVIGASLRPPSHWRRPCGHPRTSWLRVIDTDVNSQSTRHGSTPLCTGVDKGRSQGARGLRPPNGQAKKELTLCLHLIDDTSVTDILKISKITQNYLHFFYKIGQNLKLLQSPVHLMTHNN